MNARRLRRIAALHASLAREYEMEAAEQDPPKDVYVMRDGVPWAWQATQPDVRAQALALLDKYAPRKAGAR